jgi:hypothetical protein
MLDGLYCVSPYFITHYLSSYLHVQLSLFLEISRDSIRSVLKE